MRIAGESGVLCPSRAAASSIASFALLLTACGDMGVASLPDAAPDAARSIPIRQRLFSIAPAPATTNLPPTIRVVLGWDREDLDPALLDATHAGAEIIRVDTGEAVPFEAAPPPAGTVGSTLTPLEPLDVGPYLVRVALPDAVGAWPALGADRVESHFHVGSLPTIRYVARCSALNPLVVSFSQLMRTDVASRMQIEGAACEPDVFDGYDAQFRCDIPPGSFHELWPTAVIFEPGARSESGDALIELGGGGRFALDEWSRDPATGCSYVHGPWPSGE